jgi:hypothetical protein
MSFPNVTHEKGVKGKQSRRFYYYQGVSLLQKKEKGTGSNATSRSTSRSIKRFFDALALALHVHEPAAAVSFAAQL